MAIAARICPKQIAAMKYDDPFTLPPDLELSVQDAKKLWPLNAAMSLRRQSLEQLDGSINELFSA